MQRNILLKKRIGCLLAAALLAGEIGSASMVAVAAPVETTQTKVENQMENKPEVVDIPEEYITFGEPVVSEPDVKAEELDAAKAQSQENVQEKIPVIRPVEESETESLDVAKVAEGTKKEETQEELSMAFPESIPVLGNGISTTEEEKLDVVGNSEEGDSDQVNTIASISVNDVITGSGHNGVFETQYYLFTPEKSGYYGIYVPRRENCSVYMNVYRVENDNDYHYVYGSSFWDFDTYVYVSLEANKTYRISFDESYVGLEYSFDAKWIAIDDKEIAIGKNEVSVEKEHLVHLPSNNTLYKIKVQSEKGFDYELNGSGSSDGIVLKNGEENFFFYSGYSPLCLNKEVEVEDQVEITLEKVSASEYDLDNKFQEVNQYEMKMGNDTYVYSSYYSLIQYTPDEAGAYAVSVEKMSGLSVYSYSESTKQLESDYVYVTGNYGGYMCNLEANKTYYFLVSTNNIAENGMITASITRKDYEEQEVGTTKTYSGETMIPLIISVTPEKGYKVMVEKESDEQYDLYHNFHIGSYSTTFSDTKATFSGMTCGDELKIILSECDTFEQLDKITVTVEEYEIPTFQKEQLHYNKNDMTYHERYIAKVVVDETAVYELCGANYCGGSYVSVYEACRDDNNNCIGLNYVSDAYYNDSSFNMKVELKANTTYYFVDCTYSSRQPGDICLYLTDPSNYEMDLSESGENVVTCDMEILKAGEVTVTVPESGFYELGANGGEELYEISSPGMDSGLALYKDQTKVAYFSTPGTYIVRVSRELMPGDYMGEGSSAEEYMDQLTFSMRKTSSVESLSVYDGTKNTEKEVTLREAGDYAWYSFTPGKDAGYTLLTNWYEEDYGYFDKYVYELKEDCLEQIYYSNGMYELEVGKTYYVKIRTYYSEGANQHFILLESPKKGLVLNESVSVTTSYGVLAKTNIEESGIYELTITSDTDTSVYASTNSGEYYYYLDKDDPVSKTLYLGEGEVLLPIQKNNSNYDPIGLTIKLEKVDVQEDCQDIVMDKSSVWVKYVPTESQKYLVYTSNTTNEIENVALYYEADEALQYQDSSWYFKETMAYGICDLKQDVTYYLRIDSYSLPNQFALYIKPAQQITSSLNEVKEVDVDVCVEIQHDEQVTKGYYELEVTENKSPLEVLVKTSYSTYGYDFGVNGGSRLLDIRGYWGGSDWTSDVVTTVYNFSGEKTSAKVQLKRITPLEKEIKLNETFTRTVEERVEYYTFTPEETGYYQIDLGGISGIDFLEQDSWYGDWIDSGDIRYWTAGETYTFSMVEMTGTELSLDIKKLRKVYYYDYDEFSAFVASGGSITLMNNAEVPSDVRDDYENDYSNILQLGNDKVLVLSTSNFTNMNDRWYPYALDSSYVDESCKTYGDIEQYIEKSYRRKKFEGLYNEALKKVNLSDTMSNPYVAVVKYVPEYIAVQQIILSGPTVMEVGDTATIQAVLDTMNHYLPTDSTVTWSSSNSNVISVNANGEVTAKGPGTAAVIVKSNDRLGKSASITISVYQNVVYAETVTITGSQSVNVGDDIQLTATVKGKNNATPTVKGVTWTTSDATVAKVDDKGKVTGLKQGTAIITATSKDGKAAGTYSISVKNVIEKKISLNQSKITMKKDTKYTWLKVTFKPENTTDKSLTWKSSNKKIVSVNDKGVLKANGIGKATITVKSANGKTDKVEVSVTKYAIKVTKLSLPSKKTIMEGEKVDLPLEVTPLNATNQKMKWKSSNEDVATVNSKGVVTAKKAGKVTITVTAQDGSKKTDKCVITVKELSAVKDVKAKSNKKKTVEISWDSVKDADGYVIYMATEKNGKYKEIATTKKDKTSYTKTKLESKKTYYFKVCAISKEGKKQYEGKMSKVVKVKVK